MQLPLDAWQEKMQGHFAQLHAARSQQGLPVFALEHGLEQEELDKISYILRSRIKNNMSLDEHWLLWVIYATEFGYRFVDNEYWISFEEKTPGWITTNDRALQFVGWFKKFQKSYGGVVPSGDWARHFNRIALPITNAILPRYLQKLFAQAIYGLRYELIQLHSGDAKEAGRLLASNAWNAPPRFQQFLQQEELAGRILLALLDEEPTDEASISKVTLKRIVADLESVREAREWLRATRRHVADRFKGAGRDRRMLPRAPVDRTISPQAAERLKPRLQLRRDGPTEWTPLLVIPDFTEIGRVHPQLMSFLRQTRVRVNGPSDSWMPAGWTLGGAKARVLKTWPVEGNRLISFEADSIVLNTILDGDFRFPEKTSWLLHVSSDGLAREVEAENVRPGEDYVYLTKEPQPAGAAMLTPCQINCEGISGSVLKCPAALSDQDVQNLQSLGLQVSQSVRIWPSGLSARAWDGEGHSEWLTTEIPCFGIVHDHPVENYDVFVDSAKICSVRPSQPGTPVFLRLSALPAGVHRLDVVANRTAPASNNRPGRELKGYINLVVRDPKPWIAGSAAHAGLIVSLDPPQPNLEEFWEGEAGLSVFGPEGIEVKCNIELMDKNGVATLAKEVAKFNLPLTASHWCTSFQKFVDRDDSPWAFTDASSGRLTIKTEELGNFVLNLERPHTPIRWYARSAQRITSVRLLDDSGIDGLPRTYRYTFNRPAYADPLPPSLLTDSLNVEGAGGLFHASHLSLSDGLIVSTRHFESGAGFQGLVVEPNLSDLAGVDADGILDVLEMWEPARVVGPLAGQRKERVITALMQQLMGAPCGSRWIQAEKNYRSQSGNDASQQEIEKAVGAPHNSGFLVVLRQEGKKVEPRLSEMADWFSLLAERYGVCREEATCAFALQLANQPIGIRSKYKEEYKPLLSEVQNNPVVLRSARYLSLMLALQNQGRPVKWT